MLVNEECVRRNRVRAQLCCLVCVLSLFQGSVGAQSRPKNLLGASSFEIPGDNFWGFGGSKISEDDLSTDAAHGSRSLKWPYLHPWADWPSENPTSFQQFGELVYQPIAATAGQTYTVSAYGKFIPGSLGGSVRFEIWDPAREPGFNGKALATSPLYAFTTSWARYSWTLTLPPSSNGKYVLRLVLPGDSPGQSPYPVVPRARGYIDAVQFEQGSLSAYEPSSPLTFGLFPRAAANTFVWGQDVLVDFYTANSGEKAFSGSVELRLVNYFGETVLSRMIAVAVPGQGMEKQQLNLGSQLRGYFRALVLYNSVIQTEKIVNTVPPPKNIPPGESLYGADAPLFSMMLDVLRLIGVKRIRPHADLSWEYIEPVQNNFVYPDYRVNLAIGKQFELYGFMYRLPTWAQKVPGYREGMPTSVADWEDYVFHVVDHFKDRIKYWEVYNEPCHQLNSSEYLQIAQAARRGVDRVDSNLKLFGWSNSLGTSNTDYCYSDIKLELNSIFNLLSGHYYPTYAGPGGRSMYDVLQNHKLVIGNNTKELWNTEGGGSGGPSGYTTRNDFEPNDPRSNHPALTARTWAQHKAASVPYYYYWLNFPSSSQHSPAYTYSWTLHEYDSSLKAAAIATAFSAYELDGSSVQFRGFLREGTLADNKTTMMQFVRNGTDSLLVAWSDIDARKVELKSAALPAAVTVYDMFGAVRASYAAGQPFATVLDLNPTYLEIKGVSPAKITKNFFEFGSAEEAGDITLKELAPAIASRVRIYGGLSNPPSNQALLYSAEHQASSIVSYIWKAPPNVPTADTLFLYSFNEMLSTFANGAVVPDSSSFRRDATLKLQSNSLSYGDHLGLFAGGLLGNGTPNDSGISVPNSPALNDLSQFTIEMWVRPGETSSGQRLFSKGNVPNQNTGTASYVARVRETGREIILSVSDGDYTRERWSSGPLPSDNEWHHLAFVFDGSPPQPEAKRLDIYMDGVLMNGALTGNRDGRCPTSQGGPSPTCPLPAKTKNDASNLILLGQDGTGASVVFRGAADEFMMTRRALSSAEIVSHARLQKGSYYYVIDSVPSISSAPPVKISSNDLGVLVQLGVGDQLRIQSQSPVTVYSSADFQSLRVGIQPLGAIGYILSGPMNISGTQWAQVNFLDGADGWLPLVVEGMSVAGPQSWLVNSSRMALPSPPALLLVGK